MKNGFKYLKIVHTLFGWEENNIFSRTLVGLYTPFGNRPDLYGWGRTHFERRAFYGQASRGVTFQEHDNQNEHKQDLMLLIN